MISTPALRRVIPSSYLEAAQVERPREPSVRALTHGRRRRAHRGPPIRGRAQDPGKPLQVEPMKPTLKAPGTKRLNLKNVEVVSSFASNFHLRRYTLVVEHDRVRAVGAGHSW
jgi:hypothetical protein